MTQHIHENHQDKFNLFRYIKESILEFKKVVWPKRHDAVKMTSFVLIFVVIFTAIIYGIDMTIGLLLSVLTMKG